jgi:hypothetical protein
LANPAGPGAGVKLLRRINLTECAVIASILVMLYCLLFQELQR